MEGKKGATVIYLNGNIHTVDEEKPHASALVIKNDILVFVGDDYTAKKFATEDTKIVDLEGKTVLPGLIEGHTHFGWLGQSLVEIDALNKTKEDILAAVLEEANNAKEGEWVLGRGWNNEIWENTDFPTKEDLDKVSPNNPVCIIRTCCHAYWANSKALELAGITSETKDPDGGEILRKDNGEPSGVLVDNAGDDLMAVVPAYEGERLKEALLKGQEHLISYGFTSIMDAGAEVREINAMKKLCEEDAQKIRIYAYAKEGEAAEYYYERGIEVGLYNNRLTIRGVKLFADGAMGARSALLLEDYADRPGFKGLARYSKEDLHKAIRDARLNGFQLSIHANGDGSTEMVLDAYKKVLDELPLKDNRYRIEHYQLITPQHLEDAIEYGIIPSMQFVQCTTDRTMVEERLGVNSGRLERAYLWKTIVDAGMVLVNGSDAPVELVNPYHGFYAGVTRKGRDGIPEDGWYKEQCISREDALKAATIWPAFAHFEENIKGSLKEGKLADFVVIDRDYMTCPEEEIKEIKALKTVIGGQEVYNL